MHRYLLDAKRGEYVDHKNHIGLDNTNKNIIKTTNKINTTNRRKENRNSTTHIRNVSYVKKTDELLVQLQVNGKNTCFGRFKPKDIERAAALAKKLRKEIYGLDE